jgi:hypothetical protein
MTTQRCAAPPMEVSFTSRSAPVDACWEFIKQVNVAWQRCHGDVIGTREWVSISEGFYGGLALCVLGLGVSLGLRCHEVLPH